MCSHHRIASPQTGSSRKFRLTTSIWFPMVSLAGRRNFCVIGQKVLQILFILKDIFLLPRSLFKSNCRPTSNSRNFCLIDFGGSQRAPEVGRRYFYYKKYNKKLQFRVVKAFAQTRGEIILGIQVSRKSHANNRVFNAQTRERFK